MRLHDEQKEGECMGTRHYSRSALGIRVVSLVLLVASLGAPATPRVGDALSPSTAPVYDTVGAHNGVADTYGTLPLSFEANMGQADPVARFLAHGQGFALALTPDALTLTLSGGHTGTRQLAMGGSTLAPAPTASAMLRLTFAGAHANVLPVTEAPLPGVANYFIGNDSSQWRTNVPTSARVRYPDLYPGIDLTVYGTASSRVEYDVTVAPGADPTAFALTISGTDATRIDPVTGDLVLSTGGGEVRQHAPVSYQDVNGQRHAVTSGYEIRADGTVRFTVGAYDATLPLVIDPSLAYSTFLGGSNGNFGFGIAVDGSGSAYITGKTTSTDFPTTAGAFQGTFDGASTAAFVTKLNPQGMALVYSTFLGGSSGTAGNGIAVDTSGTPTSRGILPARTFPRQWAPSRERTMGAPSVMCS